MELTFKFTEFATGNAATLCAELPVALQELPAKVTMNIIPRPMGTLVDIFITITFGGEVLCLVSEKLQAYFFQHEFILMEMT